MLNVAALNSLKPKAKIYRVADAGGLCVEVTPNGTKLWRYRYRFAGKARMLALGRYGHAAGDVTLAEARRARDIAREKVNSGVDPVADEKAKEAARHLAFQHDADTFENVAREWMARQTVAEVTANKTRWLLETFIFPEIGSHPIADIRPREVLDALRKIEATGKLETARRAKIKAGQVFRYALLEGKVETDPTASLRGTLKAPRNRHHAAVTDPVRVGELLRAIDGFAGQPVTMAALKLAALVFVRPGELRHAEWPEFDLDAAMWRIPAEKMKMKAPHLVPLSTQAVAVLRELYALTGGDGYVFPSLRTASRPMSENTVNAALRRLGYSNDDMTGHGFRSMAATRLNEMGWNADAIERQLAHAESNKVRAAYTHAAQFLAERIRMMQAWADYLDALRQSGNVVSINRKQG